MADTEKNNKKRNNSGFLVSFILLLLAAGAAFYFGWVQFELPEKTYAVLFSKTGGYDKKVLEPGKFNWKWERLLPTNSKLLKIRIENRSLNLDYEGELPSSELYSSVVPEKPDFSYRISFLASYILNYDSLPALLSKNELDSDDIESFYNSIDSEILKIIKDSSTDFFNENFAIESNAYLDLEKIIHEKLKNRFPFLNFRSFTIRFIHFPDLLLYGKAKEIYYQILERKKEIEVATEQWAIESKVNMDTKLEILSTYGELLTKYPILIDYFALDPDSQVLDISNLKELNFNAGNDG